jgi:glutathione S-transferase
MIVYGSTLAPAARKVLAFIAEKGLDAEHRPVAPHDSSPAFKLASPFGQIPAFSDDAVSLCDSAAICHYLEHRYPDPPLFPADAPSYGRMVWFDQFADHFLGAAECKIVINLVVKPMRGEEVDTRTVRATMRNELPPLFDYLESQIDGSFLAGKSLSLADLAVASPFASLEAAGYLVDADRWPRLAPYVRGILGRPSMTLGGERWQRSIVI